MTRLTIAYRLLSQLTAWPRLGTLVALSSLILGSMSALPVNAATQTTSTAVAARQLVNPPPKLVHEQTLTQLPDGSWLVTGGRNELRRAQATVVLWSMHQADSLPLADMHFARVGHSATVLPDGRVLILGGQDAQGHTVESAEIFLSDSRSFVIAHIPQLISSAFHSASLLADGRILIAGGYDARGQVISQAQLLNTLTGEIEHFSPLLDVARAKHIASLIPNSGVLLKGGINNLGQAVATSELFEADRERFTSQPAQTADQLVNALTDFTPPQLVGSEPATLSKGHNPNQVLVLRFSKRMLVPSLNTSSIGLTDSQGRKIAVKVTPAENGLLVFVTPVAPLNAYAEYTLSIGEAKDEYGQVLAPKIISFETGASLIAATTASSTGTSIGKANSAGSSATNSGDLQAATASAKGSVWAGAGDQAQSSLRTAADAKKAPLIEASSLSTHPEPTSSALVNFEYNDGQEHREVLFSARGPGFRTFFISKGMIIRTRAEGSIAKVELEQHKKLIKELHEAVRRDDEAEVARIQKKARDLRVSQFRKAMQNARVTELRIEHVGANDTANYEAGDLRQTKVHYLSGNDSNRWRSNVAQYGLIRSKNVYPGIDALYYGRQTSIEMDWIVAPGAEPAQIRTRYNQKALLSLDTAGNLLINLKGEIFNQPRPVAYQMDAGGRISVPAEYKLYNDNTVGFVLGSYNKSLALVIDPVLPTTGTPTLAAAISSTSSTSANVTSNALPITTGSIDPCSLQLTHASQPVTDDPIYNPKNVTVVSPQHHQSVECNNGVAEIVDPTFSSTSIPRKESKRSPYSLKYATYLGGLTICGNGIAPTPDGGLLLYGTLPSDGYSTSTTPDPNSNYPLSITKLAPDGTSIEFVAFIGSATESCGDITKPNGSFWNNYGAKGRTVVIDSAGNISVVGTTAAVGTLPNIVEPHVVAISATETTPKVYAPGVQAFFTKLAPNGSQVLVTNYIGSFTGNTYGMAIATDQSGAVHLTGSTEIALPANTLANSDQAIGDFIRVRGLPISPPEVVGTHPFITKFTPSGAAIDYSSLLDGGKSVGAVGEGFLADADGSIVVFGYAGSDFPATSNAVDFTGHVGSMTRSLFGSFLARITSDGGRLEYSSTYPDGINDLVKIAGGYLATVSDGYLIGSGGHWWRPSVYVHGPNFEIIRDGPSLGPSGISNPVAAVGKKGEVFIAGDYGFGGTDCFIPADAPLVPLSNKGRTDCGHIMIGKIQDPLNLATEFVAMEPFSWHSESSGGSRLQTLIAPAFSTEEFGALHLVFVAPPVKFPVSASYGSAYPRWDSTGALVGFGAIASKLGLSAQSALPVRLAVEPSPSRPDKQVTLSPILEPPPGGAPLSGKVTYRANGVDLNTIDLLNDSVFDFSTFFPVGEHLLSAYYWDDVNYPSGTTWFINHEVKNFNFPQVAISAPSDNATFEATNQAEWRLDFGASPPGIGDTAPIVWIDYIADGKLLYRNATDSVYGYITFDRFASRLTLGKHQIWARVMDFQGAYVDTPIVNITISAKPAVTLLSPANGEVYRLPMPATAKATVSTQGAIASVQYTANGVLFATSIAQYASNGYSTAATGPIVVNPNSPAIPSSLQPGVYTFLTPDAQAMVQYLNQYISGLGSSIAVGKTYQTSLLQAPDFSVPLPNFKPGFYTIVATAMDLFGSTVTSAPALIEVVAADGASLGTDITFLHNDAAGNPIAATDVAGAVLWKETYTPFGERMVQAAAASSNRQWFHGKPQDAESGLQYFGARYYDPAVGRFMGIDPVSAADGAVHSFNRYAYANNNPYRFTDPDGNSPIDVAFLAYDLAKLGYAIYKGEGVEHAAVDVGLSLFGVLSPVPGTGQAMKGVKATAHATEAVKAAEKTAMAAEKVASGGEKLVGKSVGELRAAGQKDAHHIIQDAAVRDLKGYSTTKAPGHVLEGPANVAGTPHNLATAVQRQAGGGTYAAERRIGYKALRRAGESKDGARNAIGRADEYFKSIGVGPDTVTRIPGNR